MKIENNYFNHLCKYVLENYKKVVDQD